MKAFSAIAIIPSLFYFVTAGQSDIKLKFVNIVHRHGDRSPIIECPTASPTKWENGLGQLTEEGKGRAYRLGEYFRRRYNIYDGVPFLPTVYNDEDVLVVSSDVTRTIMTANFVLAGLYKISGESFRRQSPLCQPLPIRTIPKEMDNFIYFSDFLMCKNLFPELQEQLFRLQHYYMGSKINGIIKTLKEASESWPHVKVNENDIFFSIHMGHQLYDCFLIETNQLNKTLPGWALTFYPERLEEVAKFFFWMFDSNPLLKRLHCGELLKKIIHNFEDAVKGTKRKIQIYSGHDMTIVGLLQCLDVFDGELVPYASAVMLELHEVGVGKYEVLIFYRKGEDQEKLLKVPGCSERCPLEDFKYLVSQVVSDDWERECDEDDSMDVRIPGR